MPGYTSRSGIEVVPSAPHVPDAPSSRYSNLSQRSSFTRERRIVDVDVVNRSPEHYSYRPESPRTYPRLLQRDTPSPLSSSTVSTVDDDETPAQLAHYYQRQLVHRPRSRYDQDRYELALVPAGSRELVRPHPSGALIIEREPAPERKPTQLIREEKNKRLEPKVIERKQTLMLRDEKGNWTKVRRVIR